MPSAGKDFACAQEAGDNPGEPAPKHPRRLTALEIPLKKGEVSADKVIIFFAPEWFQDFILCYFSRRRSEHILDKTFFFEGYQECG